MFVKDKRVCSMNSFYTGRHIDTNFSRFRETVFTPRKKCNNFYNKL